MNRETFDQVWTWLVKFHGSSPTEAARERFFAEFKNEHDELFCRAAILHDNKQRPGNFPTLERFKSFVTEAREKAWEQKKAAEPKRGLRDYQPRAGDIRNVARGRRWIDGIIAVSEGKLSADQLIAEMASGESA